MFAARLAPLPESALLCRYQDSGAYTDCYTADLASTTSLEEFVQAFYTTAVFRLERHILRWLAGRPSLDSDIDSLLNGTSERFAAWDVEQRSENQLLMCDMHGRTRSWFMVEALGAQDAPGTRLYFGSAVVPVRDPESGVRSMGALYSALLGFHRLYSRVLLGGAHRRLQRRSSG